MSQSDDEGAVGSDDEGLESHYNRDGEEEQANTHVPSTPQQERHQPSTEGSMPPKTPKRLASALTPCHAMRRATMTS